MIAMIFRRTLYRPLMRLAHRYNWHYAPPSYPDGDTMLWCQWCGMRYVKLRRRPGTEFISSISGPAGGGMTKR